MVAVLHPDLEEKLEISGTWEAYLKLVDENTSRKRISYANGVIEIMSPLYAHESKGFLLEAILTCYCDEREIYYHGWKSTTLKADLEQKGLEPDSAFSFGHTRGDVPQLAIEVINTHGSIDKLSIYSLLGVREVWFSYTSSIKIDAFILTEGHYKPTVDVSALPGLTIEMVEQCAQKENALDAKRHLKKLMKN